MLITRRTSLLGLSGLGLVSAAGCSTTGETGAQTSRADEGKLGAMIMAHGAGPASAWNAEIETMLSPLSPEYDVEIAFGMAEVASMQTAVKKLEARGVRRIAVVRLFISGESWYERTEQILGLIPGAEPMKTDHAGHDAHGAHAGHGAQAGGGGHDMSLWRIETASTSRFELTRQGLAEAPEMGAVLVERVRALSREPARESVLVLAHGPGDDEEDKRWIAQINQRAEAVRRAGPFRKVQAETLREDWPEKRVVSEARIRAFVEQAGKDGGRVIVVPYRVSGFGPYADVLKGLDYVADQKGLLPSPAVEQWVRRQIKELNAGSFRAPLHHHQHSA